MKNNQQIPVLKQSTIKQHEVKSEPVNYSEMKRAKEASFSQESNFTAVKKNLIDQDLNDIMDSLKIAKNNVLKLIASEYASFSIDSKLELRAKAARFGELYNRLNQ